MPLLRDGIVACAGRDTAQIRFLVVRKSGGDVDLAGSDGECIIKTGELTVSGVSVRSYAGVSSAVRAGDRVSQVSEPATSHSGRAKDFL
jgi:hypothetical protein